MDAVKNEEARERRWVRPLAWGAAAALLATPLVAMQFTNEVQWTTGDFMFAAMMLGGVGLALELAVRISTHSSYRIGAGLGLAAGLLLIWVNGAVGYIGNEDNPYNLLFMGVVAIAFAGSLIAAFRPKGMSYAMLAAGIAHAAVGFAGAPQDPRTIILTIVFTGLWLGSARLFQLAAQEG